MALEQILSIVSILSMAVVAWKVVSVLQRITGDSLRSSKEERRDYINQMERWYEKVQTPSHHQSDLAIVHSQERSHQVDTDMQVNKAVVDNDKPLPKNSSPKKNPIFSTGNRSINQ